MAKRKQAPLSPLQLNARQIFLMRGMLVNLDDLIKAEPNAEAQQSLMIAYGNVRRAIAIKETPK